MAGFKGNFRLLLLFLTSKCQISFEITHLGDLSYLILYIQFCRIKRWIIIHLILNYFQMTSSSDSELEIVVRKRNVYKKIIENFGNWLDCEFFSS